ncbi:hypothetical protein ACPWT1_01050 [Ramlibacter sp. MMS24-I3-19]|uniref:hypothetical protein n=1 Tax=Ramlibacter sp. MMS24-I3-19 TaxID=3416606 RepID=UPI003D078DBD
MQRLLLVLVGARIYGNLEFGVVASDLGIATLCTCLTGGALSLDILASWQGKTRRDIAAYNGFAAIWLAGAFILVGVAMVLLSVVGAISDPAAASGFFIGSSLWQAQRSKMIAERLYGSLASIECAIALGTASGLFVAGHFATALVYHSFLLAAASLFTFVRSHERFSKPRESRGSELIHLAFNGIVSSGRDALLVPASLFIAGPRKLP